MRKFRVAAAARAIACVAALVAVPAVAQEIKIGFVNTPAILEQAPQAKEARERLQSEFASRDQKLVELAKQVKDLQDKLNRDADVMSETERRNLERDIVSQRRELSREREAFNEDLNIRRNEEFAKLQRDVAQVIVDIAKSSKYDLILESGVVYASDRVDITDTVVEQLKKRGGTGR